MVFYSTNRDHAAAVFYDIMTKGDAFFVFGLLINASLQPTVVITSWQLEYYLREKLNVYSIFKEHVQTHTLRSPLQEEYGKI